jgi:hypothetical protein
MTAYETLIKALAKVSIEERPGAWRCPAHDDNRASLGVAEGDDGRALLICRAGCPTPSVVEALDLKMSDLFGQHRGDAVVQQYVYTDEEDRPLIRVLRTYPKSFAQESWNPRTETWVPRIGNTRRVPYHLPALLDADSVWIVEGEKDVEAMEEAGEVATTVMGGAGKWRPEYLPYFEGKVVAFIADIDEPDRMGRRPGIEGVLRIKNALRGHAKGLKVYQAAKGKDATDHFNAGLAVEDLIPVETMSDALFEPVGWEEFKADRGAWLFEPWVPRGGRCLVFGKDGSLKSLWAMWVGTELAKAGHRVALFELEMQPPDTARLLRQLRPPVDRFKWYSRFRFDDATHLDAAIELMQGYSLIIVDSWSAATAQMDVRDSNQGVARLDQEVFMPLMNETGATLMILDNTGHDIRTQRGPVKAEHARGASAKHDKMDVALYFERPNPDDNYVTRIKVKKMRYHRAIPKPVTVRAEDIEGGIDFRVLDHQGLDIGSMWDGTEDPYEAPPPDRPSSLLERLKQARDRTVLGEVTP